MNGGLVVRPMVMYEPVERILSAQEKRLTNIAKYTIPKNVNSQSKFHDGIYFGN